MPLSVVDANDTQAEGMISGLSVHEVQQLLGMFKKILANELPLKLELEEDASAPVPKTLAVERATRRECFSSFSIHTLTKYWL